VGVEARLYLNWRERVSPPHLFFLTAYIRCQGHANVISLPI
jgi:hypothetical protein